MEKREAQFRQHILHSFTDVQLDQRTRNDTKVDECLNIITSLLETDGEKVVFSQWERMTRLIAQELEKREIGFEVPTTPKDLIC